MIGESPYIGWVKSKSPEPDPEYVHELNVLRAMVRQEDRQGEKGWGGTWTKERYQSLKDKHPEPVMAFEAELRWEHEEEQRRREILERYRFSRYIEEIVLWPDSEARDSYLRDLKQLRDLMIHSKKLGYGGYAMSMVYAKLRNKYPEAHDAFGRELRVLRTFGKDR
jgi:hypothetical protein